MKISPVWRKKNIKNSPFHKISPNKSLLSTQASTGCWKLQQKWSDWGHIENASQMVGSYFRYPPNHIFMMGSPVRALFMYKKWDSIWSGWPSKFTNNQSYVCHPNNIGSLPCVAPHLSIDLDLGLSLQSHQQ
jgi:hypothetical protein